MPTLSPELWQQISPYLDEVLALSLEERTVWLESFRVEKPELAELLQELLKEHAAAEHKHFLENAPLHPTNPSSLSGQTIGAYRLISAIGEGGMGSVWLAERSDGRFDRRVAIKFLRVSIAAQGGVERFKREGRILGQLADPHIAELIDAGVTLQGEPYLVLEYVEGEPIDEYCDKRKLGVEARIRLFLDVLSAVAQAHANLIVHCDLKPSNVLARNDGQVKLLDFGIAKLLAGDGNPAATLTGAGGGALTPQFAAPEQVTGGGVTTATDVYALGVLLYLLLTGQHPAGSGSHSPADLVRAIVDREPLRASDAVASAANTIAEKRATTPDRLWGQVRGDLDTILGKALKKNAAERYNSVAALADDLRRYLKHEPISTRPDTVAYRTSKFIRRNRIVVALAALAFVAVAAGLTGTLIQARTAHRQRDVAFRQLTRAEQVNNLNRFLLSDAIASGKPLMANELLDRAARIVERENYASDPFNHVEMLISIGTQYNDEDEIGKALPVLEKAYQLSRSLGDPSLRAKAACALAAPLSRQAPVQADSLIREGLHELPDEPQYAMGRVFCFMQAQDALGGANVNAQEALAMAQSAARILDASPLASNYLRLYASLQLATNYKVIGQVREALAAYDQASALITKLGYDDTRIAADLILERAQALMNAGRPLEAEGLYRQALAMSHEEQAGGIYSALLMLYSDSLRELGRLDEAADYAKRALAIAQKAQDNFMVDNCLVRIQRQYRDQHDSKRTATALDELEQRFHRDLAPGHYGFATLASERSLLARTTGDLANAMKFADQAVAIDEAAIKAGKQGAFSLPLLLDRRAVLEAETRQPENAIADAERARRLVQASVGTGAFSMEIGRSYLAQAKALQAQGKTDEARAAFRMAAQHFAKTLGPDHPDTRAAYQFAGLETQ
jgi:eukaryotic-like serine/threonine-protein kinase